MTTSQVNIARDNFETIEITWGGDLWDRKRLGLQLERYVDRLQCGAVLALDARWGEGKTWFVRHWAKHLTNTEHNVIYLDAFANDYLDDPFLVISSEITNILNQDKRTKRRVKKLIQLSASVGTALLPSLPKVALTLGLHLVGAGFLTGGLQQVYENTKDEIDTLSEEASDRIKESIQTKIAGHEAEKETLAQFKKHLAETVEKLEKPLVFIIDELDRCRPDFAIRLIERVKHFFDIKKIVFILVMDKTQFSNVVCHHYGYDKKIGEEYLDKFIDFTVGLNLLAPDLMDSFKVNIQSAFENLGIDLSNQKLDGCIELVDFYARENKLSKRAIVKLASQFSLLYLIDFDSNKNQLLIIFLLNPSFLLKSNTSIELLRILLNQMDNYIESNKDDYEKYHRENYRADTDTTALMRKANFFHDEIGIIIFIQLVEYYEQLVNSQKRFTAVSVRNLRPTNNTDFYSGWKNYIFGGI